MLGIAIAEDGQLLAVHLSPDRDGFRHDLGLASGEKHRLYRAHYSGGYELVEVADDEILAHPGLAGAIARHQELEVPAADAD